MGCFATRESLAPNHQDTTSEVPHALRLYVAMPLLLPIATGGGAEQTQKIS
jgi:hypothetical protein